MASYNNIFAEIGEKVELSGSGPYHFSKQKGLKVFLKSTPPFFTTSKGGAFEFYQNKEKHTLFSLNPSQIQFQKKIAPIIGRLRRSKWSMSAKDLVLSSKGLDPEIRTFLIKACKSISDGSVLLNFKNDAENEEISPSCRKSLKPKSQKNIQLVIIESSKMRNTNYGLGAPSTARWQLDGDSKLSFPELSGETNFNKGKMRSNGNLYFTSEISKESPVTFEAGSEVGIQQNGIFNRQPTEWKKATTNIVLEMLENEKDQTKVKITLDKRSRTGQGLVFELERLNKSVFLKNNLWKKVLTFKDKNKSRGRNGLFGLGITGSSNRSSSKSIKEVWMLVSEND